ncbi:hypothetical protein Slin15195_G059940 [Septoria linicola]|uniref:Uncharacterized protein n=1 Tax=Septoria linicola TaxID=215465 RepID=A0A9Q9AUC4_9PEZI|nr:hypothetical protein Slin14017_G075790 [Septoria linicola]USW52675.1 hypothetical protein Slin15195_G059940 [Septoria linicola]
MFSNSRPVPSKAALKLLYQLAYISSGTAVGVATLCAEERRRRTLLVQKIADNAKRIRQSPRYAHNKARKRFNEEEEQYVNTAQAQSQRNTGLYPPAGLGLDERAARGPDLPSVVDNGYLQLQQRASLTSKNGKRRRLVARHSDDHARHDVNLITRVPSRKVWDPALHSRSGMPDVISDRKLAADLQGLKRVAVGNSSASSVPPDVRWRVARRDVAQDDQHSTIGADGQCRSQAESDLPRFATVAAMRRTSTEDSSSSTAALGIRREAVRRDVALLMEFTPHIDAVVYSYCAAVAACLLRLSMSKGLLAESRSIVSWLTAHDALSPDLILTLCESCYNLVSRSDIDIAQVQSFYTSLFEMPEFLRQEEDFQVRARLAVVVDLVKPAVFDRNYSILRPLLSLGKRQEKFVMSALKQHYDVLQAKGSIDHAKNLLVAVCSHWKGHGLLSNPDFLSLLDHGIKSALKGRLLGPAMSLWILNSRVRAVELVDPQAHFLSLAKQLEGISKMVNGRQSIIQLFPICRTMDRARAKGKLWYASVLKQINAHTKTSLAIASFERHDFSPDLLKDLQHEMPPHLLAKVDEARAVNVLRRVWDETRNLSAVFAKYDVLKTSQSQSSITANGHDHLGPTEMALVEVCNLAQQPDRAIRIFVPGPSTGLQSIDAFSLAALILAHKQDWATVGTLIDTAHKSQLSIGNDDVATRRLNTVTWLHTQQHNALETWEFITSLADSVNYRINAATAKIMLRHLVSESSVGRPTLIPAWIQFVKKHGVEFQLDPAVAVGMMRRYYLAHRVPHVILMHLCRKLLSFTPQLRGFEWKSLIKQAIGYDLRESDTRRADEMQAAGADNLHNLLNHEDSVPKPSSTRSFRTRLATDNLSSRTNTLERHTAEEPRDPPRLQAKSGAGTASPLHRWDSLSHFSATTSVGQSESPLHAADQSQQPLAGAEERSMHGEASLSTDEAYNRTVEAFYAEDQDRADSAVGLADLRSSYHPNTDIQHEILPTDPIELGSYLHHEDKSGLQSDEDNDNSMLVDAFAEQQKVWYSGFNSTYSSRQQVADMIWHLSIKQYSKVLELYENSLSPTGLPAAPLALAVAVQAQIRLDGGDLREASGIIDAARNAGFNVACAKGPVLIRDMRMLNPRDKKNANALRTRVVAYYRANFEAGFPVSHHVGVSAANILIDNRCPEHGLSLLNFVYRAEWAKKNPANIVAMSVYLKGYMARRSLRGIQWVVKKVLSDGIRINRRFLHRLRTSPKAFERHSRRFANRRNTVNPETLRKLRRMRAICAERRIVQRQQAVRLGNKLVRAIGLSVRMQQASTDAEMELLLEQGHFGRSMDVDRYGKVTTKTKTHTNRLDGLAIRYSPQSYLFRRRTAQLVQAARMKTEGLGRAASLPWTRSAAYHQFRMRQYRASRKERRVATNGRLLSFRYNLAPKAGKTVSGRAVGTVSRSTRQHPHLDLERSSKRTHQDKPWLRPLQKLQAGEKTDLSRSVTLSPSLYDPLDTEDDHPAPEQPPRWRSSVRKQSPDRTRTRRGADRVVAKDTIAFRSLRLE